MKFSKFADKFVTQSGIGMLMDDLGSALRPGQDVYMLGGGNPAPIPAVRQFFRESMQRLLEHTDAFDRAVGNYDPPQGNPDFIQALAALLKSQFGWNISDKNIALTHGSQQAFFILFNMFAGPYPDGSQKKILFPLAPEYIGYCDVGLSPDLFESALPSIEMQDELFFKYHINFDALNITDDIGAICVSRPTNPTGNVLTDAEVTQLAQIAKDKEIPLIIDNAYGKPFPDIIYTDVSPYWDDNTIICMSLSKLGLPGTRTGIVIGPRELIDCIAKMNAVLTLSPGGVGTAIATEIIQNGQVLQISEQIIRPFYQQKLDFAIECARRHFTGFDCAIHQPEGSFFLWVWFKDLPVSSHQLYQRLKKRGVIVVPGHYFFFGLNQAHPHQNQCLRINHAQEADVVDQAFQIIAEEVRRMSV
ncbi:MAG: valine--pyruvate transaminase [Planctomycetota bacterium]